MSQDSAPSALHPKAVTASAKSEIRDPASRRTRAMFENLTMSSVGVEMGLCVVIGLVFGRWLDDQVGVSPLFMIVFLIFGFAAGLRGLIRAMKKSDRLAARDAAEAAAGVTQ